MLLFKRKFFKFWFPVLIWALVIFILSSIPNLQSGLEQDFVLRKIAHILEYAILNLFLIRAFTAEGLDYKKAIIFSTIVAILYALSDEYHQTFVFGREGKLKDVGIDSIGILLSDLIWYYKNKLKSRPQSKLLN